MEGAVAVAVPVTVAVTVAAAVAAAVAVATEEKISRAKVYDRDVCAHPLGGN